MNIKILATLGLTNRNELRDDGKSVGEAINEHGIPYYAMSNALELLPRLKLSETMKNHVINYFKSYGEQEVKF